MQVQQVAKDAAQWFETAPRSDGESFTRTKDGAPEWVGDMVREAHGTMLPDDWRYGAISAAVDAIAEGYGKDSHEFADSYVDDYTSALTDWLSSHSERQGYVDEASREFGPADGIVNAISLGQYMEASEVYASVYSTLEEIAEQLTEDEDADAEIPA